MERIHSGIAASLEACVGCGAAVAEGRCPHCGVAAAPGGFRVERVLAESPHSRVYLARDADGRLVALKELQFSRVPSVQELDAFEREAEALRSLRHRGIPSYVASFREGQGVGLRLYLAAEYVVGETLAARIARGPVPRDEALAIAQQLLDVLADLQRRSPPVLHRDLKPANVLLRPDGSVVLVDFGSVRMLSAERTHGSTLVGTFGYMPPEQLGGTVDRTSDLYALGATLLHALTGKPPTEWLDGGLQIQVPPGLPAPFDRWLPAVLTLDPAGRPRDADAARALLGGRTTAPRPRLWRSAAVGLVGASLALGGWTLVSGARPGPHPIPRATTTRPVSPAEAWLTRVRPHCNAVEAVQTVLRQPPPEGAEGAGAGAACLALGGKMDAARKRILALPGGQRGRAAGVVFEAGHPVADMGDDVSAAPIMQLVLEFWPENFQALYHAGMSEYALGRPSQARPLLERFMALYHLEDGFTRAARRALQRIQYGLPAEAGAQPEH
ncbi:MAG: protein kinase domain-containing protein [Myxococcaceae bacterium]